MLTRTTTDDELGLATITLTGELSQGSAGSLRRLLDTAVESGQRRVLIDLSALDDIDPSVALVLLEYDELLTAAGGWLWLVHNRGAVGSSLRFMGVHDRVRSSPSREAACWPVGT